MTMQDTCIYCDFMALKIHNLKMNMCHFGSEHRLWVLIRTTSFIEMVLMRTTIILEQIYDFIKVRFEGSRWHGFVNKK